MIYLVILFFVLILVIIVWIQIQIKKPPNLTQKQKIGLHVAFAVSVPLSILLLYYFIMVFTFLEWAITGIIALIIGIITLVQITKGGKKLTPEELEMSKDMQFEAVDGKIKVVKCRICGNLYNKYLRPWSLRMVCSEGCQMIYQEKLKEKTQKNLKSANRAMTCSCVMELLLAVIFIIVLLVIFSQFAA